MRVFELYFNPKNKEERIINSFIHEPVNTYETRLGNLYMAGELNKAMPQNARLLNNLALVIQKEYYGAGFKKSCEQSLQDSLKKANEFLDIEVRKGNVSWLGNLNFTVINLKDFTLNFTKVGDIKIFLARNGELSDISQSLEFQDTDPYPLKIFGSIATGKLSQNDKIIILNAKNENFLNELSRISDEKGLKEFLKIKKQILSETSGICLLLIADEEREAAKFSFQKSFKLPKLKKIEFVLPDPLRKLKISNGIRKKIILILSLISILALGFFIFR